ncbi:MAG: hypothetical protein WC592_04950 [Candidatus Omnitrophota bacterium]|nr:hypothetical protein [Candidatus Omnitrophota bacterium]
MKILFFLLIAMVMIAPVYAAEEKVEEDVQEEGFLSGVISSVKDKMNKVTSGEEPIFDENAKGMDDVTLMPDGDLSGRRPYMPRTGRRAGEEL